jgi:hypothetical protein
MMTMRTMENNDQPTQTWDDRDIKALLSELARHHANDPFRRAVDLATLRRLEELERFVQLVRIPAEERPRAPAAARPRICPNRIVPGG